MFMTVVVVVEWRNAVNQNVYSCIAISSIYGRTPSEYKKRNRNNKNNNNNLTTAAPPFSARTLISKSERLTSDRDLMSATVITASRTYNIEIHATEVLHQIGLDGTAFFTISAMSK